MSYKEAKLNVPVIDIKPLLLGKAESDPKVVQDIVTAIGTACKEWGFFYIIGHQIPTEFMENIQKLCKDFFQKPKDFKHSVARTATNFRGYSDAEFTKQLLDWKELFDIGSEVHDRSEQTLEVDGENQWPEGMPEFKDSMVKFFDNMHSIADVLMKTIFSSLGGDPLIFEKDFEGSKEASLLRLNYYPICTDGNGHLGVGPHSDPSALTILWQDMEVSSLQVERDGVFYDVYPLKDSYVVNIGDMVQVWSNGLYKAPVHKVLVNHTSPRYSLPFFYCPSYRCNVEPLETCISDENPCRYRPINWGLYRKRRFEGDYADVGEEIQIKHYLI